MENGIEALPDMIQDFHIRSDLKAWEVFRPDENGLDGSGIEEVASPLEGCHRKFDIHRISEPIGVDHWWHCSVRRCDRDVSPRARRTERDCKRSVIVAITGIVSDIVPLIAEISAHCQELYFWPVIRIFGEHLKGVIREPDRPLGFGDLFPRQNIRRGIGVDSRCSFVIVTVGLGLERFIEKG